MTVIEISSRPGTYREAVYQYHEFKDFSLRMGLCFHKQVDGRIGSPTYPGRLRDSHISGDELAREDWQTTIVIGLDMAAIEETRMVEKLRASVRNGWTFEVRTP